MRTFREGTVCFVSGGPYGPKWRGTSLILYFYCQHLRRVLFVFVSGGPLRAQGRVKLFQYWTFIAKIWGGYMSWGLTWSEDLKKDSNRFLKIAKLYLLQITFMFLLYRVIKCIPFAWCQIDSGAKLGPVPNWLFCTLGAKLVRCQIDSGAKLTLFTLLVPNWVRCQIDSFTLLVPNWPHNTLGAKLGPVPNCPPTRFLLRIYIRFLSFFLRFYIRFLSFFLRF